MRGDRDGLFVSGRLRFFEFCQVELGFIEQAQLRGRSLLAAASEALVLEQANELLEQLDVPRVLFQLDDVLFQIRLLLEHELLKGFDVVGKIERSIYHECMLTQIWS